MRVCRSYTQNYRKLTQDGQWPSDTTFARALGPLYGSMNLAVLRTCKSEVCVGLEPGQADELAGQDPAWRTNGQWGGTLYPYRSVHC